MLPACRPSCLGTSVPPMRLLCICVGLCKLPYKSLSLLCSSMLYLSVLLEALIEACQRSMERPSVHDFCARQACMGPRSWCVAAGAYLARYVCSVVRDSRMWCPHDIGRDSWVWGEQEALKMMNSPHELGDEAPIERSPCREEAGWPVDVSDCCC